MRIRYYSDLHLEFHLDKGKEFIRSLPNDDCDVLVLAGDINILSGLPYSLEWFCERFQKVVYVPGNHEYWGTEPSMVYGDGRLFGGQTRKPLDRLYWLNNRFAEIDGVRFVGSTLWYRDNPLNIMYEKEFVDFKRIKRFKPWVYEENTRSIAFLEQWVEPGCVVVTHYLPTPESVAPRWRGSEINRFFLCDVTPIIVEKKPAVWIHGHTHDTRDVVVGDTRVVCNPFGYPKFEENPEFDPEKTVTV